MENKTICGIYKITSPSGRVYIGESKDVMSRWLDYKGLNCKSQRKVYSSLKKYKYDNHIFEIVEECSFEDLLCRERYWQDFYDVLNGGLNLKLTQCGDLKMEHSKESRGRISSSRKGKYTGEDNPFYGKTHTGESIEKIRKYKTGRKLKPHSEESKKIMSEGKKGELNPMFGKDFSKEHRDKLSEAHIKRHKTTVHPNEKVILNTETGIFYFGTKEAAESCNMNVYTFRDYLSGKTKQINYIYV
jgi:group I intron endonuclease